MVLRRMVLWYVFGLFFRRWSSVLVLCVGLLLWIVLIGWWVSLVFFGVMLMDRWVVLMFVMMLVLVFDSLLRFFLFDMMSVVFVLSCLSVLV